MQWNSVASARGVGWGRAETGPHSFLLRAQCSAGLVSRTLQSTLHFARSEPPAGRFSPEAMGRASKYSLFPPPSLPTREGREVAHVCVRGGGVSRGPAVSRHRAQGQVNAESVPQPQSLLAAHSADEEMEAPRSKRTFFIQLGKVQSLDLNPSWQPPNSVLFHGLGEAWPWLAGQGSGGGAGGAGEGGCLHCFCLGTVGVSPAPLPPAGIASSRRAPCVWPRPRWVTAASTSAEPVTPQGLLLGATSSGCKVGPGWRLLSDALLCPDLSACSAPLPQLHVPALSLLRASSRLPHHLYFLAISSHISFHCPPLYSFHPPPVPLVAEHGVGGRGHQWGLGEGSTEDSGPRPLGSLGPLHRGRRRNHSTKEAGSLSAPRAPRNRGVQPTKALRRRPGHAQPARCLPLATGGWRRGKGDVLWHVDSM